MEDHYYYDHSKYFVSHTFAGILTLVIGLYCIFRMFTGGFNALWALILLICVYNDWNEFISLSNPSEVILNNDELTFISYNKARTYKIDEIRKFSMRAASGNSLLYMLINGGGLINGRYWVRVGDFDRGEELSEKLYDLDERLNPNSITTTARRQGRERIAKKKAQKGP